MRTFDELIKASCEVLGMTPMAVTWEEVMAHESLSDALRCGRCNFDGVFGVTTVFVWRGVMVWICDD